MVREEKRYRGKIMNISVDNEVHVDFDQWIYGGLTYDAVDDEFHIVCIDEEEGRPILFTPREDTIHASTFKKDSQNVMVFEKDILNFTDNEGKQLFHIVVDDNGVLGLTPLDRYKADHWQHNTLPIHSTIADEIFSRARVVGNTVDEPEWIKIYG